MIGYDMTSNDPAEWGAAGKQQPAGPGTPVAAAAGPAPGRGNSIILIGGGKPRQSPDPSQPGGRSPDTLVCDRIGNKKTRPGEWPARTAPRPPARGNLTGMPGHDELCDAARLCR